MTASARGRWQIAESNDCAVLERAAASAILARRNDGLPFRVTSRDVTARKALRSDEMSDKPQRAARAKDRSLISRFFFSVPVQIGFSGPVRRAYGVGSHRRCLRFNRLPHHALRRSRTAVGAASTLLTRLLWRSDN